MPQDTNTVEKPAPTEATTVQGTNRYGTRTAFVTANDNSNRQQSPAMPLPTPANENQPFSTATPPHTHTESTLAPTSEFARYLLTAWGARYLPRGLFKATMDEVEDKGSGFFGKIRQTINRFIGRPGEWLQHKFPGSTRESKINLAYNATLGIASALLTLDYSWIVYKDIKHMFCEAVGAEIDKPADQVTFADIRHSDNKIVQRTMQNFSHRFVQRIIVDALFAPAAWLRSEGIGDALLGTKALQLFAETWKRKTTMFEDLVSFVNNKINPRNGLGQPIGLGEIFDLYQHYEQEFAPDRAFSNVLERGTGEGVLWARSEPIFQRITTLMNQTYAYKHPSIINPETGHAIRQADFPLPTFIYLLGHDLIDLRNPERTQLFIEVANSHGIAGVKEMRTALAQGATNADIMTQYRITLPPPQPAPEHKANEKNGVIAKGSTVQLDVAPQPSMLIDASTILHAPLISHPQQML